MLKSLSIENIAVIERADIELDLGLNILSGETGAGKSIIIDAINAVLGERTSKELIRNNCTKASVTAHFTDVSDEVCSVASELGVVLEEKSVIVKRILSSDGKNLCYINGESATLTMLKTIGKHLINIHGQHDNQALLNEQNHCAFLDLFSNNSKLIADYRDSFYKLRDVKRVIRSVQNELSEKEKKLELLEYRIDEISSANIFVGERESLANKRLTIENSEKIATQLSFTHEMLAGNDDTQGILSSIDMTVLALSSISDFLEDVKCSADKLTAIKYDINEIIDDIRTISSNVEFNSQELLEIEQRLDFLFKLSVKYGDEQQMLDTLQRDRAEVERIDLSQKELNKMYLEEEYLEVEVYEKGTLVTKSRAEASMRFSKEICSILKDLEMPGVTFTVKINQARYTSNGCDEVSFLISANSGEKEKALSKVASGGELSRIMLAIKSAFAGIDGVKTTIFDEIDSGISGRAAGKVGQQLKAVSKSSQVICVTHLASIACLADNHMLIEKSISGGRTYTNIEKIYGDKRITEIARLLSGAEMTENLYNTAKELIDNMNIV